MNSYALQRLGAVAVMLLLLTGFAEAQAPVKARLDSAAMLLGDPNRLVITVAGSAPVEGVGWWALDTMEAVVALGPPTQTQTPEGTVVAFPFSVYDSVGLLFPPVPVFVGGDTLYTNDVALLVDFPPVDTLFNPYRPLRTESANLSDYLPWIIGVVLGLVVLGAILYLLVFAKREEDVQAAPVTIPDPAHVVALRELTALGHGDALDDKAYYSSLDQILRTYLEGRYNIPALERTSSEVTQLLRTQGMPDSDELSDLLSQVDLIKFAKAELPRERRAEAAARIRAFVEATKTVPVSPTETQA